MNERQREDALKYRRLQRFPKHSPPHFDFEGEHQYIITGACYEHLHIIGKTAERMTECETEVLQTCVEFSKQIYAWCFLPNHYHILLKTDRIKELRKSIGLFHGRSSFKWNGEDVSRGRQVWHNCFERAMRSKRHFYASLNYVWNWSNAKEYLERTGKEKALEIWRDYPILDYGKKWDKF